MKGSVFNWLIGLDTHNEGTALCPLLPLPSNTSSHLLLLPVGNNFGRYLGFLACDYYLLVLLAFLFFSLPCYNLGIGKAFLNMALTVEITKV